MKLTTKRNRWYFWRELFSYLIPMILIVWVVDVFFSFMQCPLHPEWSVPCGVNRILAAIYGFFLILVIILAIISANELRKVKKKIENEFLEVANQAGHKSENKLEETKKVEEKSEEIEEVKVEKPKKIIVKSDRKDSVKKVVKKETKKEANKATKSSSKKESTTKKKSAK